VEFRSEVVAFLLVAVAVMVAAVLGLRLILRRRLGSGNGSPQSADTVMEPLAGVYAMLLAFLLASVAENISKMGSALEEEGVAITQLYQMAALLPKQPAADLQRAIRAYARAEAKKPDAGDSVTPALPALNQMWVALARFEPANDRERMLQSEALNELRVVREQRRIVSASGRPRPAPLVWVVLLFSSFSVLAVCVVSGLADSRSPFYLTMLAALIAITLVALYVVSKPLNEAAFRAAIPFDT
jgi:hypothetical protein